MIVFERQPWPGAPLQEGSEGPSVLYYTVLLQRIGYYFDSVQSLSLSNRYTPETVVATRSLQALLNLPVDRHRGPGDLGGSRGAGLAAGGLYPQRRPQCGSGQPVPLGMHWAREASARRWSRSPAG